MVCKIKNTPRDYGNMGFSYIDCDKKSEETKLIKELNKYFKEENICWKANSVREYSNGGKGIIVSPSYNPNKMHLLLFNGFGLGKGR